MSLGISTAWNASLHSDAKKIVQEIKALGFQEVELSFNLTPKMVEEVSDLVKSEEIKVVSLHNFCPIPDGLNREEALPDCFSMASQDETIRRKAVELTKRTIDTANSLQAKAVVLHCGRVEIPARTVELCALYSRGMRNTTTFAKLKEDIENERLRNARPYFENTLKSLEELNKHATEKNILLGVETRFYYREIPSLDEIGLILQTFKDSNIYYWHDVGHAQLMENLGFCRPDDFITRYAGALLGVHVHDITGCHDHQAPSKGEFDFNRLTPFLKKETITIIEAHQPASGQEIIESKQYLERLWNGKNDHS